MEARGVPLSGTRLSMPVSPPAAELVSRPLRIVVVTSQFPIAGDLNRGRPLLQTIRALSALAEVRVVAPIAVYPGWARPRTYVFRPPAALEVDAGCPVVQATYGAFPVLSRAFNGWASGRAVLPHAARWKPDVMLAYWLYPDAFGAMFAARRLGVPLVAGARGSDLRVRDALSRRLTRPVLRFATRLLTVSEDLARIATTEYGAARARIRVIPNGCDAAVFRRRPRAAARSALQVPQDAELVLYVGRLVAEKGLRELLAAAAMLRSRRPRSRVVLVGDGPMRSELEAAVAKLPAGAVQLCGALAPPLVADWMSASDLVTLPSYSEGHPNVLVEALACGRAVVATPVGGVLEIVDAESGLLVPPRDAPALAEGIDAALGREWDEARLAGRYSRSWSQVAAETLAACREAGAMTPW